MITEVGFMSTVLIKYEIYHNRSYLFVITRCTILSVHDVFGQCITCCVLLVLCRTSIFRALNRVIIIL